MTVTCHYDGEDHSLLIVDVLADEGESPRCTLVAYSDRDGWRCFTDHDGAVVRMRYDLAEPSIDCSLVGELMGLPAQSGARRVLDEVRTQPGVSHTHAVHD